MKNITLSVDDTSLGLRAETARSQPEPLNTAFPEWLQQYTSQSGNVAEFDSLIGRLRGHVRAGRKFTRDR
jgi:hypothetical protein